MRIKHGIPFPPRPVVSSGNMDVTVTIWYTLQRCVTLPMKETQPCCLSELQSPSILPWYGARCESKANHCPSPHNTYPPICGAAGNKDRYLATLPSFYSNHPVRWEGHALPRCWPPQRTQPGNSLPRICEREKIAAVFSVPCQISW